MKPDELERRAERFWSTYGTADHVPLTHRERGALRALIASHRARMFLSGLRMGRPIAFWRRYREAEFLYVQHRSAELGITPDERSV